MEDTPIILGILTIGVLIGMALTVGFATPIELENGCIVNNDKVYCEYKVGK